MTPELSTELQSAIEIAVDFAQENRHEFVGTEHLFWGLLEQDSIRKALHNCDAELKVLQEETLEFLETEVTTIPEDFTMMELPSLSLVSHQAISLAAHHAIASGAQVIDALNLLIAFFRFDQSHCVYFLKMQDVTRFKLTRYHAQHVRKGKSATDFLEEDFWNELDSTDLETDGDDDEIDLDSLFDSTDDSDDDEDDEEDSEKGIRAYVSNLTKKAEKGKLDPMIGRAKELDRTIHILSRRRKNNPIFVGEAGVGKTAIAEGLALAIYNKKVPVSLQDAIILSLDIGSLVAGTRYRGDFEERIKKVLKQVKKIPNVILFIDEIHTFIGAGAVSGGALDASSIFKPMLARGELRCIGATTWKEYRNVFEKDQAFARRFQKVEINEPSVKECIEILQGLKSHYEEFHGVDYHEDALAETARLAGRYFHDRFLPDKAIDVMDEAGAEVKLLQRKEVLQSDIESTIARMASIPTQEINQDDKVQLKRLEPELKSVVFGQDEAVGQLVSAIKLSRAGLGDPDQPIGSFIFTGPTGVGKTEVAKQLAKTLGLELIRFDMSEYMERHTVSRLIGAPPGYVGYEQGGLLTDAVTKSPHSIVLLDEIEKAHPEVFNLLLQVMDHGTLTDNNGKKSDFRHVILIMTSNVGAQESQRNRPGFFNANQKRTGDDSEAFKRTFSPEFRNRLHAQVRFASLSPEVCKLVAVKMSKEIQNQLLLKHVELHFTEMAIRTLSTLGYDPLNGARPMQRVLRTHVKRLIADDLLFGDLSEGGALLIDASQDWLDHWLDQDQDEDKLENKAKKIEGRAERLPKFEGAPFIHFMGQNAMDHKDWPYEEDSVSDQALTDMKEILSEDDQELTKAKEVLSKAQEEPKDSKIDDTSKKQSKD
jgi:ATP-dependent Clp protease ATP-binding subunit ClpA